jgi:hypothetical protein
MFSASFIKQGNYGTVFYSLTHSIYRADDAAKGICCILFLFHQWCTCKSYFAGIWQYLIHFYGHFLILAAVSLIGDDDDIAAVAQHRVFFFAVGGGEFLNRRENQQLHIFVQI